MAAMEVLQNVARHSAAKEAVLSIGLERETLRVSVRDNGRGFDPGHTRDGGRGVTNIQDRIRELGGQCRVESSPGAGTSWEFSVRLGEHPSVEEAHGS